MRTIDLFIDATGSSTDRSCHSPLQELYQKSLDKPEEFWRDQAHKYLHVRALRQFGLID